jgi:hypothetical protein
VLERVADKVRANEAGPARYKEGSQL